MVEEFHAKFEEENVFPLFEKANKLNPKDAQAYHDRGVAHYSRQQPAATRNAPSVNA